MSNPRACQPLKVKALAPVVRDLTPEYEGPVNVVPSTETQTLETAGKKLESNVTIAAIPKIFYPHKKMIIKFDTNGDGIDEEFFIVKANDFIVEVLYRPRTYTNIDKPDTNIYENSSIDLYFNETYYNSLSEICKNAIVDKVIQQDNWNYSSSTGTSTSYNGIYYPSQAYNVSLINPEYGNSITRHCYALSVQDILDCFDVTKEMTNSNTTLYPTNLFPMFYSTSGMLYLRSASSGLGQWLSLSPYVGSISTLQGYARAAVIPAFQIDLSKITWSLA